MNDTDDLIKSSSLYREFQAEREAILAHKWQLSEKVGHDVGFEYALTDWIVKHRQRRRKSRMEQGRLSQRGERVPVRPYSEGREPVGS